MFFLFFKQKTAYEMRISDWSSDVCSSDLIHLQQNEHVGTTYKRALTRFHRARDHKVARDFNCLNGDETRHSWFVRLPQTEGQTMRKPRDFEIGRASCRERGCQYG